MQSEYVQKLRRVPAQRRVPLADPVQEVEVLGLRKFLRFSNACREVFPRDDGLDCGEGITAILPGRQQRLPNSSIKPELLVDRFAVCLELFLMLVLGGVEQFADDPVVQADHFVRDGRRSFDSQRDQSRIAPLAL